MTGRRVGDIQPDAMGSCEWNQVTNSGTNQKPISSRGMTNYEIGPIGPHWNQIRPHRTTPHRIGAH